MSSIYVALTRRTFVKVAGLCMLLALLLMAVPIAVHAYPLTDLPVLNSRTSAIATLVLDFDGDIQLDYGGPGNTVTTPAYDLDGDPLTFSDQELANIRTIWAIVAEDYAPYGINVTTVDTGNLDDYVTQKVIIGGDGAWAGGGPGGGVAGGYSFTNPGRRNTAFVFGQGQGTYLGDVSSHEAGHTFGLGHQNLWDPNTNTLLQEYNPGDANWGPFMGGAWGRYITFYNGTSGGVDTHQNDMQVVGTLNINASLQGFTYAPDRAGARKETPAALMTNGNTVNQFGIINLSDDVDYYRFTTSGGNVTFNCDPGLAASTDTGAPNVIPTLELRDSTGALITTVTNAGEPNCTLTRSLAAGDYFLTVRSNGTYGYCGSYKLTGTIPGSVTTVIWDGDTATGGLQEGAGTWNTTDANRWYNGTGYQAWNNGSPVNAVFGQDVVNTSTAYSIPLGGPITAKSITFNEGGQYTISGNTITLASNGQIINNFKGAISSNITMAGPGAICNTSNWVTFALSGAVNNGGYTLSVGGAKDTQFSNVISGAGGLTKYDAGTLILSATNTYSGPTIIAGGVVRATDGVGLPATNLTLGGGSLETSGTFARLLGTGANQVQFTSGTTPSGLSARGGALTVNINNNGSTLTWGSANFDPNGLVLNADTADSAITLTNGLDLAGAARVFYVGANTATINGAVTGSAGSSIVKQGAGTLLLTQGASLGGGPMTITAGTVNTNNYDLTATSLYMGGDATGTSSALNVGTGTVYLQGDLTYDAWSNNGASITGAAINLSAGTHTFNIQAGPSFTLTTPLTGPGNLVKDGWGSMALGNNASFTGAITINKGTIQMNSANAFGTTAAGTTFNGGSLTALQSNAENFTIGGNTEFDCWGGSPVLTGSVVVNSGATWTLATGGGNWMGVNGPISGPGNIFLNHNPTWAPITFGGTAANTLSGTLTLGSGGITLAKTAGVDAVAGNVTIGTTGKAYLVLGANNQIKDTSVITLVGAGDARGGALRLNGFNETISGIVSGVSGDGIIENTSASTASTLTINSAANSTFDGIVRDGSTAALNLAKSGSGNLTLGGSNLSYTGTTSVDAGTLTINGTKSGSGAVTVASGATLGGGGTIAGTVTMNSGGRLTPGVDAVTFGILTAGGLTASGGTLDYLLGTTITSDKIQINAGVLTASGTNAFSFTAGAGFGAGTYVLIDYGTFSGSLANFTVPATLNGLTLSLRDSGTSIDLKALSAAGEYALTTGGNWNSAGSWSAAIPNGVGAEANFLDNLAAPGTVTLNTAVTAGNIRFNNVNSYTIGGANSLTLNTSGANATIISAIGSHVISAPVVLSKTVDVTVAAADQTLTFSGNISGAGYGINLVGPGTTLLSGSNTFTGTVAVNGGTLKVAGGNAIANTGTVTVASGAAFDLNGSDETFASINSSGTINVNGGALRLTSASTVAGLTGTGTVYKTGTGDMTLGNNANYSGDINITGGNLALSAGSASLGNTTGSTTLNGVVWGPIATTAENFVITGGTTNFSSWGGNPNVSGTITVQAGATLLQDTGGGNTTTISGVLAGPGNFTWVGGGSGGWADNASYLSGTAANTLSGAYALTQGTLSLNKTAGVDAISSSGITVGGGSNRAILLLGANEQINNAAVVTLKNSTSFNDGDGKAYLRLAGFSETIGGLGSFAAGGGIVENTAVADSTLTFNNTATSTFSGIARDGTGGGKLNLAKTGTGTQVLTGANTYTGTTTVSGGSLLINGNQTGAGTVTVASGGTLGGNGTIAGPVSVSSGGKLNPGPDSATTGTLTMASLTLSGITLDYLLNTTGASDKIQLNSGALTATGTNAFTFADAGGVAAGTYTLIDYGTFSGSLANFSVPATLGSWSLALSNSGTSIDLIVSTGAVTDATWNNASGGNWSVAGNWTPGLPVSGNTTTVRFTNAVSGSVSVNAATTVNRMIFDNSSSSYTIAGASTLTLAGTTPTINVVSGNHTISAVIAGSAGLTKSGTGKITLSGANTFTGGLTIANGTLSTATINTTSTNGPLGRSTGATTMGGSGTTGTLQYTGANVTSARTFTLASGGGGAFEVTTAGTTLTQSGIISGSGSFTKAGPGTMILSGANTYTGASTVSAGILQAGRANAFGSTGTSAVTVASGATLRINGYNQSISSLAGSGSVTNNSSSGAALLTTSGSDTATFSGVMANGSSRTFGLVRGGTGRQTLTGVNTYTGPTTVSGGTLVLGGSGSINSTSGITLSGGTLLQNSSTALNRTVTFTSGTIGGTGTFTGNMTPGTVHIAPGDGGAGTFGITGALTMASGSVLDFDLSTVGGSNDLLTMTGALTLDGTINVTAPGGVLGGGTYTLISGFTSLTNNTLNFGTMPGGHTYTITTDASHVYLNAAPEPGSLILLGLGALALLKRRSDRSRKA